MRSVALLRRHPAVFRSLTGIDVAVFDDLLPEVLAGLSAADQSRLSRPSRTRAIGGGHPSALAPAEQVLAMLVWLRCYPTDRVLGFFFGVESSTIRRLRRRVLLVLERLGADTMRLPDPGQGHRRDAAAMLVLVPELAVIVDPDAQPVQRPQARTRPDPW